MAEIVTPEEVQHEVEHSLDHESLAEQVEELKEEIQEHEQEHLTEQVERVDAEPQPEVSEREQWRNEQRQILQSLTSSQAEIAASLSEIKSHLISPPTEAEPEAVEVVMPEPQPEESVEPEPKSTPKRGFHLTAGLRHRA